MSATPVNALITAGVIGDVVDMFVPENIKLTVTYASISTQVRNGSNLLPSSLAIKPSVSIGGQADTFYTLIMTDPDAPSPSNPIFREYLQWMVTDIPANSSDSMGRELMSYDAPHPATGIHRFVFVVFRQVARQTVTAPSWRLKFNMRNFAQLHALGPPLAAIYFNAKREITGRRRS